MWSPASGREDGIIGSQFNSGALVLFFSQCYLHPVSRPTINRQAKPTKSAQSGLADFSQLRTNSVDVHVHAGSTHHHSLSAQDALLACFINFLSHSLTGNLITKPFIKGNGILVKFVDIQFNKYCTICRRPFLCFFHKHFPDSMILEL